jgi:hypothetical protein
MNVVCPTYLGGGVCILVLVIQLFLFAVPSHSLFPSLLSLLFGFFIKLHLDI